MDRRGWEWLMATTRRQIDEFLDLKRIAIVGVSRQPKEFSHVLWQEFRQRRVDAIAVNPAVSELDGKPCYAKVQDIKPGVEGVLVITKPELAAQIVRDCVEAGVKRVWLYAGIGRGAATKEALELCEANGIDVIAGFCPYMFFKGTPFFHSFHAFGKRITGSYPKSA